MDDVQLTESDAAAWLHMNRTDLSDTLALRRLVKDWCTYQAMLLELKASYPEKYASLNTQSVFYQGEMALYYLEEQKFKAQTSQEVADSTIRRYYEANKKEYELQDFLVKALYIKIPVGQEKIEEKLREKYRLSKSKDIRQVEAIAKLNAENFYFNDQEWAYFNEVFEDAPMEQFNKQTFVINRTKTWFKDEKFVYFINILDYKLKTDTPPFDFLKDRIRETILAKKLNDLRADRQSELVRQIKQKHEIKINTP